MKRGFDVLRDKALNRSLVFGRKDRDRLGLRGLLPHRVSTQRQMVDRVMTNLERLPRDIDRYMLLSSLQERNERLFYRTVIDHVDRILPLIYTPTVGEACRELSHIAREPKGFFVTPPTAAARAVLQRRHPGDGCGRARRCLFVDAHHRDPVQGSADHVSRRRFGSDGHCRSHDHRVRRRRLSPSEARRHLWFVDVNGLVVSARTDLLEHQRPYAHDLEPLAFVDAIDAIRPHVLIGATGAPGTFTRTVIQRMSAITDRPVIFALSNPTSRAECTPAQAFAWSNGRAVVATGSPFEPVNYAGKLLRPAQGNNAYVFPGIGLGAVACRARTLPDELFLAAARALANLVRPSDLDHGSVYPPLRDIRKISLSIAVSVATRAYAMNLAREKRPPSIRRSIEAIRYRP